ncbi:hypothetical protein ACLOJK_038352, partial [Asimina triloba]
RSLNRRHHKQRMIARLAHLDNPPVPFLSLAPSVDGSKHRLACLHSPPLRRCTPPAPSACRHVGAKSTAPWHIASLATAMIDQAGIDHAVNATITRRICYIK